MNQEEFFQSNQVDGQLTDLQMAQMLNLPEGDTASAERSVPDAAVVVETPAPVAEAKVEAVVEPVILAKDGVHTIPFSKLEEARQGEQHWKGIAAEQQKQIEALAQKPAAEVAPAVSSSIDDKEQLYIDALMDGDADAAKAIRREINAELAQQAEAKINAALEPIQKQRQISATDAHFDAIAKAHPDFESIGQSQELAQWIAKQPSFTRSGYEKVIAEGSAQEAIELFDAFKASTGKPTVVTGRPDTAELAKAAIANAKSRPPSSLSEIPAGSGVQHDEAAAMLEMSAVGVMNKFEGKTPEQINALLSRII
jgi:hypothetical protein